MFVTFSRWFSLTLWSQRKYQYFYRVFYFKRCRYC